MSDVLSLQIPTRSIWKLAATAAAASVIVKDT